MGGTASFATAVAVLPFSGTGVLRNRLRQLMSGVRAELKDCGAELTGGHTAEGESLCLALNVTGNVKKSRLSEKRGAKAGQVLILTKALGTGTLFRANMYNEAAGNLIENALRSMLFSNRNAVETFERFNVKACTDVSGFGLAGHLLEMVEGSDLVCELDFAKIALLKGAEETLRSGFLSTMHPNNEKFLEKTDVSATVRSLETFPILFDPQTSGPLAIAVEPSLAERLLANLREMGYGEADAIGKLVGEKSPEFNLRVR